MATPRVNPVNNRRIIPQYLVPRILELHAADCTDRQIAKSIGINHRTVATYRRKAGLLSNGTVQQHINLVGADRAKCSKCGEVKSTVDWPLVRGKRRGVHHLLSYCKDCRKLQVMQAVNKSDFANLRSRWHRLRARGVELGIMCTITFDEFWSQWLLQGGRCFYSDVDLMLTYGAGKSPNSCSVDKVEPHLGYVSSNVVFASNRINAVKSDLTLEEMRAWMPGWFERVKMWREMGVPCFQVAPGPF